MSYKYSPAVSLIIALGVSGCETAPSPEPQKKPLPVEIEIPAGEVVPLPAPNIQDLNLPPLPEASATLKAEADAAPVVKTESPIKVVEVAPAAEVIKEIPAKEIPKEKARESYAS